MSYDNWLEKKFGEKRRRLKLKNEERKLNSSKTSDEFHRKFMDLIVERGKKTRRDNAIVC